MGLDMAGRSRELQIEWSVEKSSRDTGGGRPRAFQTGQFHCDIFGTDRKSTSSTAVPIERSTTSPQARGPLNDVDWSCGTHDTLFYLPLCAPLRAESTFGRR